MDLQNIGDFIALATHKSFSKAAGARHVTQPAFSRRIKALEESLGVQLVNRETTPLSLTPAGAHFLLHAQSLAGLSATILADMQAMATQMPKALHIVMSNSLSSMFFPAWYGRMQQQVRGLTFRLSHQRSAQSLDDLRSGLADFAVHLNVRSVKRTFDYSGIRQQIIGRDHMLLVKSPHLPASHKGLIVHGPGSYMNACLKKLLGPEQLASLKVVFESPTSEFSRGMVLAGFGAALLQHHLVEGNLKDGTLVPALPHIKPLPAEIVLLRPDRPLSPRAEALWLKSAL